MAFPTATVTQGSGLTVNTLPNAGQATMANSLGVAIASDQSAIPVTPSLPSGAATAAGVATVNTTLGSPAQDGTDATGVTPPSGAVGIRGWLSSIWNKLNTSIVVTGTFWQGTQPVSAASLPLPTGAMGSSGGTVGLVAGSAAIGSIIGRSSAPSVTPTVTAGAYTAGQEAGGLMTFPIGGAGSGLLEGIVVTCKSVQTTALKLYIFDTNPTNSSWSDKTTPAINVADINSIRGVFLLSSPDSGLGTCTVWNLEGIACSFIGANLYGVLVVVGTPTFASTSDISVELGVVDD